MPIRNKSKVYSIATQCRVCNGTFFEEALITYKNMPKAAQHLPDSDNLENDKGLMLQVFQCEDCGLVQLNNKPVDYFREVIRAAGISEEMKEFRIKQFGNFIDSLDLKNKNIVEIGCGQGEYLSVMDQLKVNATGLEYSKKSVEICNKLGLQVDRGYLEHENIKIKNAPLDGFFILNFLEHLPNINEALQAIYNNLSDDGVGLIEVPNFDMILEKNLFSEFIGDHLFYFTKESLETTLNFNGFEIIDSAIVWYDYVISVHVKKTEPRKNPPILIEKTNIDHFTQHQEMITQTIVEYLDSFEDKKVAIWGAGHQSLAIIALTNIEKRIAYVVDSADFKQNKFTPATHIPIVAPEKLSSDPVEAIIIMAASYSDEVARNILMDKDNESNVSILRESGLEIIR